MTLNWPLIFSIAAGVLNMLPAAAEIVFSGLRGRIRYPVLCAAGTAVMLISNALAGSFLGGWPSDGSFVLFVFGEAALFIAGIILAAAYLMTGSRTAGAIFALCGAAAMILPGIESPAPFTVAFGVLCAALRTADICFGRGISAEK